MEEDVVDERRAERAVFDCVDGEGGKGASERVLLYVSPRCFVGVNPLNPE